MNTSITSILRHVPLAACGAVIAFFVGEARAISLVQANTIGFVVPSEPANPATETARLQFFIDLYNGGSAIAPDNNQYTLVLGSALPPTLPSPATFGTTIPANALNPLPITISNPYLYLMAKFGPDSVYYYLGGQTGSLDALYIPPGLGGTGNGLSHISLFNQIGSGGGGGGASVPDGGLTSMLFGGGLLIVGLVRRKVSIS
jgi:hypothetical protein